MIQRFCLFVLLLLMYSPDRLLSQDQIFLRSGDGILDCYIMSVNDSLIIFRTLDPKDTNEYEIPFADTYGFLMEDLSQLQNPDSQPRYRLVFSHPHKHRHPQFAVEKGMLFKLKNDTMLLPRRGRITALSPDSIQLEIKRKRVPERISYALDDIEMFGYTTMWTEIATLVVIPTSSVKEGSLQFYRQMTLSKGWSWELKPVIENTVPLKRIKRKFRPGQLLKLPKSVRRKTPRDK
jgi:hypothetical protein